ncbi:hypothetical protein ACFL1G_02770 [Planctomycetota bacterium]
MAFIADIVIYGQNGDLALVVETKNKKGASIEWAQNMVRNMFVHSMMPKAPFFLLALPDHFFLWKNMNLDPEQTEKPYDINPAPLLKPYYEKSGLVPETVSGESFALFVSSWLSEIIQLNEPTDIARRNKRWLINSGLFEAIKNGHLELEARL